MSVKQWDQILFIVTELAVPLSLPLCDLFTFSLQNGQVLTSWKEAYVTPIHKKDDPSIVSNYRPISLLNTIGKAMEKIVHKHTRAVPKVRGQHG